MKNIRSLTLTALFVALILLMWYIPVFTIPLGFINVSIVCVPVILGTLLLGLPTGLLLGACFGGVSCLGAFGILGTPSSLAGTLVAANPLLAVVMCFVPRLLVPVNAHLVYRAISRQKDKSVKAVPFAAAAGSLTNTVFYLGLMLLFYVILGINYENLLALIGGTGLIAGGAEAAVAALISSPILAALWKLKK